MAVLHIEHAITDFVTWKSAFDGLAGARARAGVLAHRIHRPVDDPAYVLIDLDFAEQAQAEQFLTFLHTKVWASREASPALKGDPRTRILTQVENRGS